MSIMGHSMGGTSSIPCAVSLRGETTRAAIADTIHVGHGALSIYLKNLDKYKSASSFAAAW